MEVRRLARVALLATAAAPLAARAGTVTVANPSFESPQTTFAQPGADGWTTAGPTSFGAGVFQNTPAGQPGNISNAVGNQLAFMSTASGTELSQVVSANFKPDERYTLSVGVAKSMVSPPQPGDKLRIELFHDAGNTRQPVAFTDVTNDATANLSDSQLKYFSTTTPFVGPDDPFANHPIGILFTTIGLEGYLDLDNVTLTSQLIADANGDGTVNFSDMLLLAQHYGGRGDFADGDFNGDGTVGFDDLLTLAQHYGQSESAAEVVAAVPEPAVVAVVFSTCWLARRRRHG